MTRSHLIALGLSAILGILTLARPAAQAQTAPPAATASDTADVRKVMDQGQYRDALKQIAKLLPGMQQDDPASQQKRFDLLMLRGECLLQLGQRLAAVEAFDSAAHSAADPAAAAIPRAYAVLIRRSTDNQYRPKGGGAAIDIRTADSRKAAMTALYTDLAAAVQPKLQKALNSNTLQDMIDLLPAMRDLDSLEVATTGKDDQTRQQLTAMGQRARDLMRRALRQTSLRFDEIVSLSDTNWGPNYNVTGGVVRRTFTTPQANELNSLLAYVQKIDQTARQGREFCVQMGGDPRAWEPVIADADDLVDRFNAILAP